MIITLFSVLFFVASPHFLGLFLGRHSYVGDSSEQVCFCLYRVVIKLQLLSGCNPNTLDSAMGSVPPDRNCFGEIPTTLVPNAVSFHLDVVHIFGQEQL